MSTLSRPVIFALVGALGFACQLGVLHLLVEAGIPVAVATALAVATAVAHNYLWHRGWTWRDRTGNAGSPRAQFLRFAGLNGLVSLAGNVVITATLAAAGIPVLGANVVAVVACSVANYALADRLVFATAAVLMTAGMADAAVLESRTLAGWQEYVKATELRIAAEDADRSAGAPGADQWRRLRAGAGVADRSARRGVVTARQSTLPGGAVHHWVGQVFLPGVALTDLLAELQAPTSRAWVPAEVRRMRVTADPNGGLRVFMRVERDSLVDVTYDIEHAVQYRDARGRARHQPQHVPSHRPDRRPRDSCRAWASRGTGLRLSCGGSTPTGAMSRSTAACSSCASRLR